MTALPDCYGTMFPDFTRLEHNRPVDGVTCSALVLRHGLGPPSQKLEIKREGCAECAKCPAYRTCYDFSLAQLLMRTLLASGCYRA